MSRRLVTIIGALLIVGSLIGVGSYSAGSADDVEESDCQEGQEYWDRLMEWSEEQDRIHGTPTEFEEERVPEFLTWLEQNEPPPLLEPYSQQLVQSLSALGFMGTPTLIQELGLADGLATIEVRVDQLEAEARVVAGACPDYAFIHELIDEATPEATTPEN